MTFKRRHSRVGCHLFDGLQCCGLSGIGSFLLKLTASSVWALVGAFSCENAIIHTVAAPHLCHRYAKSKKKKKKRGKGKTKRAAGGNDQGPSRLEVVGCLFSIQLLMKCGVFSTHAN